MPELISSAYFSFVSQYHYLEAFWWLASGDVEVEGWEFQISRGQSLTKPELINDTLSMMGFMHLEAILENFLLEALEALYQHNPQCIPRDKDRTIKFRDFLAAKSREEILRAIVYEEVRGVPRSLPKMILQFRRFGLKLDRGLELPYFEEMAATRNVWAHTGGLVDEQYLEDSSDYWKMIGKQPPEQGEVRQVSPQYFGRSAGRSRRLADRIEQLIGDQSPKACNEQSPEPSDEELEPWERILPWELSHMEWSELRFRVLSAPEEARRYLEKVLASNRPIESWSTNRGGDS